MSDHDPSLTRSVLSIIERYPDGTANSFCYRLDPEVCTLLIEALGTPDSVMRIDAPTLELMATCTRAHCASPGVERWEPDGDHMPEALWPDDRDL